MSSSKPNGSAKPPATTGLGAQHQRLWCLIAALITWNGASSLWEAGSTPIHGHATVLMLLTYGVGFGLLLLAALPTAAERHGAVAIPVAMTLVALCFLQNHLVAQLEHGAVTTDVHVYMDYAGRLLREGINPYSVDLLEGYRLHRVPLTFSTPLVDGGLTGQLAYPALSFLILVPFQLLGIPTEWVYPVILLIGLGLLYYWAPRQWRPVVWLPFFVDPRFLLYTLGTVSDVTWAVLLAVTAATWHRPRTRAVAFGLALAVKHQPWVLAPLLLIRLWHDTEGDRRDKLGAIRRFVVWAGAVFLAVNLPFFVWSPGAWVTGVLEPVIAPMITLGQGLSAVTMSGFLIVPKWAFSFLMVAAYGLAAWLLHRYHPWARSAVWVIPGFALWFGNRSLSSYWYFFLFPLVAELITERGGPVSSRPVRPRALLWAAVVFAAMVALVLVGSGWRDPGFRIEVHPILWTAGDQVEKLSVSVENTSNQALRPRFSVQSTSLQPYFWEIVTGPPTLAPGERARYVLQAEAPYHRFWLRHGARVLVSSADGYGQRASALVAGDVRAAYRDAIPNPEFRYWDTKQRRPTYWGLVSVPPRLARAIPVEPRGPDAPASAVRLEWPGGTAADYFIAALDTYMVLPRGPVEMSVWLPPEANRLPDLEQVYGLRLLVRGEPFFFLFGDRATQGEWADRGHYVMLPAPRGRWSTHRIDLRRELAAAGIDVRPLVASWDQATDWDYAVLPINLQLFVSGPSAATPHRATFGPIRSSTLRPPASELFDQSRRHPEVIEAWRGDWAFAHRNHGQAQRHYEAAAALAPDVALLRLRVGEARFWQGQWRAAAADYRATVALDDQQSLAFKGLGWCHFNLGELDEAVSAWERAVSLLENRPTRGSRVHAADALKGLAMVAAKLSQCDEAQEYLRQARALEPALTVPAGALAACPD
ncbi:MAG: hypothetical protein JRI68_01185 [Deltaproteobacteria bacterium]|nr:hypothetical protein [Deltaproteobacteria bacterium]